MIDIESFDPKKHYLEVSKWWSFHKWPSVPVSHLSQSGLIVYVNKKPAACAWIYKTDSAFCLLEFLVANPEVRKEERTMAISSLISCAKMVAKKMGFLSMFTSIKHESLAHRLKMHGFNPSDEGMTNYICELGDI